MKLLSPFAAPADALLESGSTAAVAIAFARTALSLHNRAWIDVNNPYRRDVVGRLKRDRGLRRFKSQKRLAEYVAASTLTHCLDGWSYYGKAISALLSGNCHLARHLAYYSQLRAAMAFLATQGVGVFNRDHCVVSAKRVQLFQIKPGTHEFVWQALLTWSRSASAGETLTKLLRPFDTTLFDLIGGSRAQALAFTAKWLAVWGVDIQKFADDRERRNDASYRPTSLAPPQLVNAVDIVNFVAELWGILEPSGRHCFEELDCHLARLALEKVYTNIKRISPSKNAARFDAYVAARLDSLNFETAAGTGARDFLTRSVQPNDSPILLYSRITSEDNPLQYTFGMISRALVLLRIASGASRALLRTAGTAPALLSSWLDDLGISLGLWAPGSMPADVHDLWADIEFALSEVTQIRADPLQQNLKVIHETYASPVLCLSKGEHGFLWGCL